MTEIAKHEPGSFSWAELSTSDPAAAKKFYSSLFGWSVKDSPMGPGPEDVYTLLQIGGKDVAALYKQMKEQAQQGVPPNWMCYVTVENADEAAKKAKSLGGTVIMEPFDVMDYGRMAVIQDPEGAIFSIWQPMKHIGVQRSGEPNTMCWCELKTWDAAKAGKFYTSLFGWSLKTSDPSYHEILRGGTPIGGIFPLTQEMKGVPAHWGIYFQVESCDGAVEKAATLGGKVCFPPTDIPKTGRFAALQDPQGAFFNVIKLDG
jgi:predicted enzyme related to lactoylglutathione lyase